MYNFIGFHLVGIVKADLNLLIISLGFFLVFFCHMTTIGTFQN